MPVSVGNNSQIFTGMLVNDRFK